MSVAMAAEPHDQAGNADWGQSGCTAQGNGRLHDDTVVATDRNCSVAMHLAPLALAMGVGPLALAAPLVIWLVRKDESRFSDDHGRESLNFLISLFFMHLILGITVVGIAFYPVLWVLHIVSAIRASIAAGRGEYFRYPVTWRIL